VASSAPASLSAAAAAADECNELCLVELRQRFAFTLVSVSLTPRVAELALAAGCPVSPIYTDFIYLTSIFCVVFFVLYCTSVFKTFQKGRCITDYHISSFSFDLKPNS